MTFGNAPLMKCGHRATAILFGFGMLANYWCPVCEETEFAEVGDGTVERELTEVEMKSFGSE